MSELKALGEELAQKISLAPATLTCHIEMAVFLIFITYLFTSNITFAVFEYCDEIVLRHFYFAEQERFIFKIMELVQIT